MQAQLAKENGIGKKLLAVLMAVVLAVGVALPLGVLSGIDEAWADASSDSYYWNNKDDVKYFYWRFDRTDLTGNNTSATGNDFTTVNSYAKHVTVTYTNGNNGSGTVPYTIYDDHNSGVTTDYNDQQSALNCSSVLGATSSSNFENSSVRVVTDVGYVVTGYVIACETNGSTGGVHIGEACTTVSGYNLDVTLDTTGKYFSDFTINITPATFGHDSNAKDTNNYVLLLQIAEVNVNVNVTKTASAESVPAGGDVVYTVTATTTNDLTNVTFTDEFITAGMVSGVKYNEKELEPATSMSGWTYTSAPDKYYVSDGVLYIDGKWTSGNPIQITYSYTTTEAQANTTITNTVVVTGTKTDTSSTVQDMGVAQVKVIVNTPTEGSLRVYKTFSGLTTAEVTKALETFQITIKDSDGNSCPVDGPTYHSSQTATAPYTYTYFWDATSLEPGTYTVTESNADVSGYARVTTYTVQVDAADSTDGTGTEVSALVEAGKTTYVRITNSYGNSVPAVKIVKQWKDASGNLMTLSASDSLPDVTFVVKSGGTTVATATLSEDNLNTDENAWVYYCLLDDAYDPATLTVEESPIDGYVLDGDITKETGKTYVVTETVTETDEEGNIVSTREESKIYDCTVFYAVNKVSAADVTISKTVAGNLGDQAKEFSFNVKITLPNGSTYVPDGYSDAAKEDGSFDLTLRHGGFVTFEDVPVGFKVVVAETSSGYDVSINDVADDDAVFSGTVTSDGLTVAYLNTSNANIDTGVSLESLPYVLLLGGALICGAILVGRTVLKRKED